MNRKALGVLLQIAVSAALLLLVARQVPLDESLAALSRVHGGTIAASVALSLIGYVGRAFRWRVLLRQAGMAIGLAAAYRLTLIGTFYGLATPGRVGEFARVLHLRVSRSRGLASVLWDRIGDVLLLELMALPAFLLLPAWHGPVLWIYLAVVAATAVSVYVIQHPRAIGLLKRMAPRLTHSLERYREASAGMLRPHTVVRSAAGGLFFYAFSFAAAWVLLRELVPGVSPWLALSFPVIPLLGNLPIAFGGLGLREQVSAAMFGQFGAGAAVGPVFSLLWFATTTLAPALLGLALSATRWGAPHAVDAPSEAIR